MKKLSVVNSNNPQFITVNEEEEAQRIDNYLIKLLKNVPKSHIYRILRKGEVRVNKGRVKAAYRIQVGDIVRIPPIKLQITPVVTAGVKQLAWIDSSIVYEDSKLLIINKPSGLAVHGGSGISLGVIECLRQARPDAPLLELVHRLDRETSGCLLIAKKRSALRYLHQLFQTNQIQKTYVALVQGPWSGGVQHVKAALTKNMLSSGERIVRVDAQGKQAHSIFEPLEVFKNSTLVRVRLKTGRTHQIRVHASHIGHPIAGDEKYGDKEFNKIMKQHHVKRLFLHAQSLRFIHPDTDEVLLVEAPLHTDLTTVLEDLQRT
ncbi:MAG: 23S rRNA pseudouridine(955/2504/2580) synthase RluC [Gammaproteobacteria bacterium]|nr:23S rRNA pseudouridine(955/2504/2580) synthase RluC [Gammaproteobacteria bacterium]MDH5802417.1 23S rRNA pseudouridine(955/2504/2580) synthase RluC [Gammaproteobacteria bacterium]